MEPLLIKSLQEYVSVLSESSDEDDTMSDYNSVSNSSCDSDSCDSDHETGHWNAAEVDSSSGSEFGDEALGMGWQHVDGMNEIQNDIAGLFD